MATGDRGKRRRARARRIAFDLLSDLTDIQGIIQVGLGDWAEGPVLLSLFPNAKFLAIEPIQRYIESAQMCGFPGHIVQGVAAEQDGLEFTFSDQRTCTSIHESGKGRLGEITASSYTLQTLFETYCNGDWSPILLWMDCEGYEKHVLRGAEESFWSKVGYVICELKDVPRNEHWAPAYELIHAFGLLGFDLVRRNRDGLFVNRSQGL